MYDKHSSIIDRREMLRIKLKTLAEEARIIRREERRTHGPLREQLYLHRIGTVRAAARNTHIAYGFIRGRAYVQIEAAPQSDPNWGEIERMIKQYGPRDFDPQALQQWRKGWEKQKAA